MNHKLIHILAPLFRLLQLMKDSPSKVDQIGVKVRTANDAVQSIKQLRREIVEIMSQLLCLAKLKNPKGMLPLCNEMVTKTRALLNLWEPSLVEEAFEFIENHRIVEDTTENPTLPMSPFRKITQQLGALDLKSPDLEDFATPMGPAPDLWPQIKAVKVIADESLSTPNNKTKSPSTTDINAIASIQTSVKRFNRINSLQETLDRNDTMVQSLPVAINLNNTNNAGVTERNGLRFSETHFDVNGDVQSLQSSGSAEHDSETQQALIRKNSKNLDEDYSQIATENQLNESKNEILLNSGEFDENGMPLNCSILLGHNGTFLDTKVMSSSPSANYYRPTEEPEPLDLTQLNIEASVMCLVSKVKFLCGRCGSPAVRLRQPKDSIRRGFATVCISFGSVF